MIKFLKKAVSAFLASVMCIPTGIVNIANAEENDTDTVTTVTLSDTDNGIMQFSQECIDASTADQDGYHMVQVGEDGELDQIENDGSIWAFNAGDKVEVELVPDDEYNVKSFTIKDSNSGDVMAHKETMDNVFSFTMPNQSLTVEAVFSSSSTVEIVEELTNGGELDVESKYHDITESAEITQEEVEEVIFDLATESYIKANLNPAYMTVNGKGAPVDILPVKQTLYDGKYVEPGDTIDSIMDSIEADDENADENLMKFLGQVQATTYIYDFDENSDYYVTYANTMQKDEGYTVQDWQFAYNDLSGRALDGCVYDNATGLLYIPKQLYSQLNKEENNELAISSMQVQFMQVYHDNDNMARTTEEDIPEMQSSVYTIGVDDNGESIDVSTGTQDIFSLETTTTVEAGMNPENLSVSVNGVIMPEDSYDYDPDTGNIEIGMSSAAVVSVEAWENGETLKDQLVDISAGEVNGEPAQSIAYKDMKALDNIEVPWDKLPKEDNSDLFKPARVTGVLGYPGGKHATGKEQYYLSEDNNHTSSGNYDPGRESAGTRLAKYALGDIGLNAADIKPHKLEPGQDLYISCDLSNAKPKRDRDEWIKEKGLLPFIRCIKAMHSTCTHLYKTGFSNPLNENVFAVRVVKIKDAVQKDYGWKDIGGGWKQRTKTAKKGYMILSFLGAEIGKQTTCNLVRVNFHSSDVEEKKEDEKPDPFALVLFKDINPVTAWGDGMSKATLDGAVYRVDFYKDQKYNTVRELESKSKKASWTFTTSSTKKGSPNYAKFMKEMKESPSGYPYTPAGVDFCPTIWDSSNRSGWKNNFINPDDLESWQNNFGKKGTYHIYEVSASEGFLTSGEMFNGSTGTSVSSDPEKGIVVYMNGDKDNPKVLINGADAEGNRIMQSAGAGAAIRAAEDRAFLGQYSFAKFTDSGEQYAEADQGPVKFSEQVLVRPVEGYESMTYYINTSCLDKTTGKYIDVNWDTSSGGTVETPDPDEPMSRSSITHSFTQEDWNNHLAEHPTDEHHVTFINGTVSSDGMEGHTLVFMNTVYAITSSGDRIDIEDDEDDEDDGSGDIPEVDSENDNIAISVSSEEEPTEYLYFTKNEGHAGTQIISSQIQRKSGTGESIAYAGKYKDETCKEGGGSVLQSMTDTIEYSGLTPNKSYTIKGWLVDLETNEKAKDTAGNAIEITDGTSQTASATGSGKWDVRYEFDGTGLDGKKFVSFIEIYDGSTLAFEFKNKDDKYESFMVPSVQTQLTDQDTGTNLTAAGNSLLVDTITYKNLLPGLRYKIVSRLVDAETGDVGLDKNGNPMQCETYKVAEGESGSFDVELAFQINKSNGKKYVAFEEIFLEKGSPDSGNWVLVADHKDIMDKNQMTSVTGMNTFAKDQKTDHHLSYPEKNVHIYDTVHYEDVIPGLKYIIYSDLVDAATGEIVVDDDGKQQSLVSEFIADEDFDAGRYGSYGDIIPENHDGNGVTFSFNAESFAGRTLVVFERMYLEDKDGNLQLVADHQDLADENQTIRFPKIWTNAIDVETQTNISYADETAIIKDTVSYENLIPGLTYELHGRVIDRKKTMESGGKEVVVVGTDGKPAENKVVFTPDTANGEQELTFDIDLKKYVDDLNESYAGAVFVVYEDLYVIQRYDGADDRSIVASHTDINDEDQTIYLPKITTSLDDSKTGTKLSYAEKDAHLIDTINYYNLKPSTQYTVKGRLYNMEDGTVLPGSEKNQQFTSNAEGTGSWKLDYTFDASDMKGMIVVAYAEVYIGDKVVATHDEFWDVEERVYFPEITTDAMDLKTGDNISLAEKTMKIIDTVHYKSLSPGYTYKLVSELRDQATNEIVTDDAGNKQVLTTHFKTDFELLDKQYLTFGDIVPKAADSDEATFTLDAEYFAGRTLVIFERLYIENESGEHLIADHQDLLDERQTVSVGGIWSDAIDMDTFTKTLHSGTGRATVIDTVGYTNLLPGHTYELRGYVVEKDRTIHAGTNVLATAPGGGEARNSMQFVPSSSKGSVRLSFDIDVSKYATDEYKGAVLVVYQELYHIKDDKGNADMRLVATHTDIGNLRQTVYIPYIWTDLNDYKTGTKVLLAEEDAHIVDTISYTRFQPNSTYTVKGKIIDMEKGTTLTDSAGKKVEKEMEVTASDTGAGEWKLDYEFDASKLQGKILVAYADVYVKNGERPDILSRVATHSNFWDTKQRVYIPKISTVATDQKTNSHVTFAEDNAWVTDRIYYSHLQPDTEYRLISKLVDKDTKEVVVDDKKVKQEIESTFTTTPNESQEKYIQTIKNPFAGSDDTGIGYSYGYIIPADGTTLPDGSKYKGVVFNFDAHTFEGRTLVIFEELQMRTKDGYQTIATHMDIDDENQTVHIPKIRTNAVDSETLTHSSKMDGAMTVIDTITYENLIPGFTYEVEGFLMDKTRDDTKGYSVIKDAKGNPITNKKEFVADKPDGTVKLSLSGDARSFQTDEGEFSSETLVVFERLYLKNNKDASDDRLVVAVHEDINDENQTIYCPRISTKVVSYDFGEESKDGDADHVAGFAAYECDYCKTRFTSEHDVQSHIKKTPACLNFKNSYSTVTEATIYDRVYYENLIPGRTYEIVGHIIDVKTGKAVTINNRMVQSEKKYFTPGTSNGEVDVVFHVTGLDLAGGRYVCYEELFYNGTSIAEHKDKFDDNQTFYVPDMVTSAMDYDTKSNISKADTISTIIDTVEMTGLKENEKYRLSSVLMDATTDAKSGAKSSNYGSYFIDGTGNAVHAKEWRKKGSTVWHSMDEYFTIDSALSPEDYRGTAAIEVKFEVDTITEHGGKDYQGMTYVVFQELYTENGTLVAQHKDITDKQQTIYVGGMYTVALDGSPINGTMTNLMDGTSGDRTLVDYIYYSNLLPNKSYYVTTNVYIKEMSKGGNPDTDVMQPFEAENAVGLMAHQYTTKSTGSGYWAINISLSGEKLKDYLDKSENGITLVVYEEIHEGTMDGKRVALENNLYNESQSVHIPKIKSTVEEDKVSGLHYTLSEGKWICDNDECVVYACDGCGKEFHSEEEAADHLYDCREGDSYTCTSGVFGSKAEAEAHVAPVYECNNCKLHFTGEADAEAHVNGRCKDAAVVRATQLVRDEDNNVINELWYACSACGSQFKTNKECLDHIGGSDTCYNYTNINAAHHSYTNINAGVTDTVNYSNLIPGKKYRIQGKIYNTETKEPALTADEEEITSSRTFIPMASQGSVKLDFEFDGTYLAGHKYAVYTEILLVDSRYDTTTASTINNPVVITKHNENLDDKEEAFYIPKVSTSAKDYYTQTNVTKADSTTTIVDDVTFEGLNTTDKYCIKGIIMDKETMEPLVLADGSQAEAATGTFQVDSSTDGGRGYGTKQLRFTFSTSDLEGKTLVVFEKLYLVRGNKETLIGQHTEIMDEKQTTHIPKMRTYAYDAETGEQTAGADESVTLVDRVVMENLVKGKRYKLEAKLVDPATGKVLQDVNGHDITGTLDMYENRYNEFTASTSGRTERTVKFVFDGSDMAGKSVVVHETLYMEDTTGSFSVIANHCPLPDVNNTEGEDLDYRNQRIDFPGISTSAKDALTGTEFTKDSETATIIDTVTYNNLTAGLEYKLVGSIYDLKHKTLLTDTFNDTFTSTKYFTPDATGNGTVDLSFTFNTKDMAGNTFVVYEELYLNGEKIAEHKDPSDLKQTFKIPTIKTSAVSEDIGLKMTMADKDAVIIDTVTYKNLIEDREYRVTGKLMDKNTGKPLLDAQEEEITGETVFRPETADGTVEVEFRFDASKMEGMAAVVYEELFYMDKLIADHKEIKDEGQTVYFPKVRSLAKGNETDGTHIGPADSIMTITDTVFYENLIGDREYHIAGVVMDAETGKPAIDANGDEVREEKTFTTAHPDADAISKAVSGSEDMVFTFDATGMRGKTLVIYEHIYYHKTTTSYLDYEVGKHAELEDEAQMIHIPEIGTTAWDSETRQHITKADDDATIIDTVAYKNLVPDKEYTLDAYLIDLDTGGEVAVDDYGVEIKGTTTFVPKDWEGTVDVRFDNYEITSLAGHTLVAFEYLYYKGILIEHHDNPEDGAQTINIPKIATHASNFESDSGNANAEAYVNVVDEIEYWNLVPGLEYIAVGIIINKETGQPARDAEGKYIKGTTTFTPDNADGTTEVVFTFNAEGMEETDLVVFEEIFYQGDLYERKSVAEHSDLMDEEQSVSIPKIKTFMSDAKTELKLANAEEDKDPFYKPYIPIHRLSFICNLLPCKFYWYIGICICNSC